MPEFKTVADFLNKNDADNTLSSAQQGLSLVELANRIKAQPVELQTKQQELVLKRQQALMYEINTEKAYVDLKSARSREMRDQTRFVTEQLKELPSIFAQDPQAGQVVLEHMFPGAKSQMGEDGIVGVLMPGANGAMKSFEVPTRMVADPEKRAAIETTYRKELLTQAENVSILEKNMKDMRAAAMQATGAGDLAIVIAYMKMLDPRSIVREGEQLMAQKTTNIPNWLWNRYLEQKSSDAPILGAAGSKQRENFITMAQEVFNSEKAAYMYRAKQYHDIAGRMRLDARNVIIPVAGVTAELLGDTTAYNEEIARIDSGATETSAAYHEPTARRSQTEQALAQSTRRNSGRPLSKALQKVQASALGTLTPDQEALVQPPAKEWKTKDGRQKALSDMMGIATTPIQQ